MRIHCSVDRVLAFCSLTTALCLSPLVGCGPPPMDASFAGGSDTEFGTLVDDRGTFTFDTDEEGSVTSIEVAGQGTITLPSESENFAIQRNDGGTVSFAPSGDDVLVVIRNDPDLGALGMSELSLTVSRDDLGGFGDLMSARASRGPMSVNCDASRDFLDDICTIVGQISVEDLVDLVLAELRSQGVDFPFMDSIIADFFNKYLDLITDCCGAWSEYRGLSQENDPCA